MNLTNITEFNDIAPILDADDNGHDASGESHGFEFIENSILKVIPKFFRAIATLLIGGLLLGLTLLLITLWKRGCRTHSKLKEDARGKNGSAHLHSVIVTPPNDDDSLDESSRPEAIPSSSLQPVRAKYMKVPMPKQALLRRASGPFGSEALSFVGEQYTMKTMEKEGHHHHQHHHHHHGSGHSGHGSSSPHHFHSGASSTGGGSASAQVEDNNETKSKWNCFKGTKE